MTSNDNEDTKYLPSSDVDIDDEDDEEFFDDDDNDESDNDVDDDSGGDDENGNDNDNEKKNHKDAIVMQGSLNVNEEGRYVYSGTWTLQRDLKESEAQKRDAEEDGKRRDDANNNNSKEKKKKKFKLKSKKQLNDESEGGSNLSAKTTMNLLTIARLDDDGDETRDKPQSILFDGFFVTDETDTIQPHRKVKERDVEITFSRILDPLTRGSSSSSRDDGLTSKRRYRVDGRGANEFGAFSIEGMYTPHQQHCVHKNGKGGGVSIPQPLTCQKWYTPIIKPKKRRRAGADYGDESDDDYEISGDEADFEEVIGLQSEAGMSIEELRKKYYGGGETLRGKDGDNETASKRSKLMEDDDDDGCGF